MSCYFAALKDCGFRRIEIETEPSKPSVADALPHAVSRKAHSARLASEVDGLSRIEESERSRAAQAAKAAAIKMKAAEDAAEAERQRLQWEKDDEQARLDAETEKLEDGRRKLIEQYGQCFLWRPNSEQGEGGSDKLSREALNKKLLK